MAWNGSTESRTVNAISLHNFYGYSHSNAVADSHPLSLCLVTPQGACLCFPSHFFPIFSKLEQFVRMDVLLSLALPHMHGSKFIFLTSGSFMSSLYWFKHHVYEFTGFSLVHVMFLAEAAFAIFAQNYTILLPVCIVCVVGCGFPFPMLMFWEAIWVFFVSQWRW